MSKRDKITLGIFVFVTVTAGWFGYLVDQILTEQPAGNSLGMGLWLVLPLLTGIVLRVFNRNLGEIGARPRFKNNLKWYAVAFLAFPAAMLVSMGIAGICGGLHMENGEKGLKGILVLMLFTFLGSCIKNIFEEFAWRGCLVPFLEKTGMNDWVLYGVSGLIWGMWHVTYYLFFLPDEYFTETSRPMMVLIGIVLMILWSPLFVELRRLTGSVWPCVILHVVEDAVPTFLFVTAAIFQIQKSYALMLDPVSGVVATGVVVLMGLGMRSYRRKKCQK